MSDQSEGDRGSHFPDSGHTRPIETRTGYSPNGTHATGPSAGRPASGALDIRFENRLATARKLEQHNQLYRYPARPGEVNDKPVGFY